MLRNGNSTVQCKGPAGSLFRQKHNWRKTIPTSLRRDKIGDGLRIKGGFITAKVLTSCQIYCGAWSWTDSLCCFLCPSASSELCLRRQTQAGWVLVGLERRAIGEPLMSSCMKHESMPPRSSRSLNTIGCTYIKLHIIYVCTPAITFNTTFLLPHRNIHTQSWPQKSAHPDICATQQPVRISGFPACVRRLISLSCLNTKYEAIVSSWLA